MQEVYSAKKKIERFKGMKGENKIKILVFEELSTVYITELLKIISSEQFDITYLFCRYAPNRQPAQALKKNYKERKISSILVPIKVGGHGGTYYEPFSIDLILSILKTRPDILVIDPNKGISSLYMLIAKIFGGKIIGLTDNLIDSSSFWGKLSELVLRLNDVWVSEYVVPISVKKESLIKLGIKGSKINVIGYGIDSNLYNQKMVNPAHALPENKKIILFVGRFVPTKGLNYLVESFEIVKQKTNEVFLVLIGKGPEKHNIEQLIKNKKLERDVLMINNATNEEIPNYYLKANVSIVPSIVPEPFGLVYLEAMASQKPVVTFAVGGGEKDLILDGERGFCVEPRNTKELANAIIDLLSNDEKLESMGSKARKFVEENYDFKIVSAKWQAVIKNVLREYKN